ncbi:unnamed protein product [Dicrocoelium dendriticum]|nr:unnamed protein product [Dicrocoelium dendriticum]
MYELEFTEPCSSRRGMSVEDKRALEQMESSIVKCGSHYQLNLPWKSACPNLPNNYPVAYRRLMSLRKRLVANPELHQMYTAAVEEYASSGFVEMIDLGPLGDKKGVWYMPHHAVTHPNKPGKVRVVFDCASTYQGTSLNQQLLKGPDLVNSLVGVLLRFRMDKVAVTADIEAMFHQVMVTPKDRDYLRFLWWPKGRLHESPKAFRMTVHPFGATSSPCCASFALRRTIEDCRTEYPESTLNLMQRCFYVDDCLFSCGSREEASLLITQFEAIASKGGFHLRKWKCNDDQILQQMMTSASANESVQLTLQSENVQPTLGLKWHLSDDCITFSLRKFEGDCTRRSILSFIAAIYDPLGLIAPVLLRAKQLLQSFVRRGFAWDIQVDGPEREEWYCFLRDTQLLERLRIPRCVRPKPFTDDDMQLHCFSDASEHGYGAAVYVRIVGRNNQIWSTLIMGKSRVSPIRAVTIPRLELTAAVLAVRLAIQAVEELQLDKPPIFWTDSMVVLQLIRCTTKRFTTFIANRLSEIHQFSDPKQWRYVETSANPADIASRGLRVCDGVQMGKWLEGAYFLRLKEVHWPKLPESLSEIPNEWLKKEHVTVHSATLTNTWLDRFASCSSWVKLKRCVATLLRFKRYLLKRCGRGLNNPTDGRLTLSELNEAEVEIVRNVQQISFAEEIKVLGANRQKEAVRCLKRSNCSLKGLCPFLINGILRVGGRLNWAPLPYDARHPVLLPAQHYVTRLIILDCHERNGHVGVSHVLSELRQRYWILHGVSAVRKVLKACARCMIWKAQPCEQQMAPLIEDRCMAYQPAFTAVGVDYFGPLLVKEKRTTGKRYGCIFTCLSVRAVHIEITHAMDTDSFLCAFSRFVSRRGVPLRVYSDNGQNFRGAEGELRGIIRSWNQDKLSRMLNDRNCEWIFNPPYASHRGGAWERLIRSIRTILRVILGNRLVNDEILQTTLVEVERILNQRPLVPNPGHPDEFGAISPSQLLTLTADRALDPEQARIPHRLTRQWRQVQQLSDEFWKRWLTCYLPILQFRQKWHTKRRSLRRGDLVLIADVRTPRGLWPKGIIEEAKAGRDGLVREVLIRTNKGTLRRDVRQVCLLEETLDEEFSEEAKDAGGV